MASNIGKHELLTPLHAIDGALELLIDGSIAKLDNDARDVVGIIATSARSLRRNLNLLLDYVEITDRKPAFRSVHAIGDLTSALNITVQPPDALGVEVDLSGMSQAVDILRDRCGLTHGTDDRALVLCEAAVTVRLGILGTDLQAGEGELPLFVASRMIEAAGGELALGTNNAVSIHVAIALSSEDHSICE